MYGPSQTPQPLPLRSWNNARSSDSLVSSARFWAIVEWGEPNLAPAPTCGDGIAECSEDCDDGNQIEGDGCDSTCEQADCGDGALQPGEECDDGNLVDGDGCEATCEFTCVPGDVNASLSATVSDVICLLHHVFLTLKCFPQPCWSAGDMNCNGVVTSADIITLINYLFKSMPLAECDRCAPCGV
jgi:cysteine-rich repeat protein